MRLAGGPDRFVSVASHAGRVVAFSSRPRGSDGSSGMGYSVLNPGADNPDLDASWSEFVFLDFPRELRTVGRSVITVDFGSDDIPVADVPFGVVSDSRYLYVFRQSTNSSLYFDRFVLDEATGRVINAWEVRFRRSRKPDIPSDRRDTLGSTDMSERRFVAPTIELDFIDNLTGGRFAALVIPTELAGVDRWQIFAVDSKSGRLNSFSLARATDGSFDLTDAMDQTGGVPPAASLALQSDGNALILSTGPAAALYNQQEWLRDQAGRESLQKLETRVMVATGTDPVGCVAIADFGIGRDGRIAQVDGTLPIAPVLQPGTALEFVRDAGTRVTMPSLPSSSAFTIEAWIAPRSTSTEVDVIVQSASFLLGLDGGVPVFVGPGGTTVVGERAVGTHEWTHLAGVWDNGATLYVNGSHVDGPARPIQKPAAPATGYLVGGPNGLTGAVNELRLWSVARTQDEILATMNSGVTSSTPGWADLTGYWKMVEPLGNARFTAVPNSSSLGTSADGVLEGARWVPTSAPTGASLAPVAWDANGLTVATGLLPFATAGAAPTLAEGPDSQIHLYCSARADQSLITARCSAVVARATYQLKWSANDPTDPNNDEDGALTMVARQVGTPMNATTTSPPFVAVEATRSDPTLATVTLRSYSGYQEQWPEVPLDLNAFTAVLNGDAVQVTTDPAEKARDVVMYDYNKVVVTPAGGQRAPVPGPGTGSAVFGARPNTLPTNGRPALILPTDGAPATSARAGMDPRWQATPPLLGIAMTKPSQCFGIDSADAAGYDGQLLAERDLAVEAWVNYVANTTGEDQTLFVFNSPGKTQYSVAIDGGGRAKAANGDVVARSGVPLPAGVWTHLAASYRTDFGLQLGGARYLDAGNDRSLDSTDAVTIEGWVRLDAIGQPQVIAAKWDSQRGQSWRLAVDETGQLALDVIQSTATGQLARHVAATTPLTIGKWHHVAGVYDVAFERVVALMFDVGSAVRIPAVKSEPVDGVTVAMWIKLPPDTRDDTQIIMKSATTAKLPFRLFLRDRKPTFWVNDGGTEHWIEAPTALRADDWLHVAGSYQRQRTPSIMLTIDGIQMHPTAQAAAEIVEPGMVDAAYTVGSENPPLSLVGAISELSLWNRGLELDEIRQKIRQPLAANERGLAGYWRFNDAFGNTAMDLAGTANGDIVKANFVRLDKGAFAHKVFVDGAMEAFNRALDPIVLSETSVTLGSGQFTDYFQGAIGEMRLWSVGRMNWQIAHFGNRDLEANAEGLVAGWPFDTGRGVVVFDAKGDNNAVIKDGLTELTREAVDAMWIRTSFKAAWTFLVDGAEVPSVAADAPTDAFGIRQATIGGVVGQAGAVLRELTGELQELRVWNRQLLGCEVRDRMHLASPGPETGLAACWGMSDGSGTVVTDSSGGGAHGTWMGTGNGPAWQLSTAPVGAEAPQIRPVPGASYIPRNAKSQWACGIGSYGQLEPRPRGASAAVLKRAYAYVGLGAVPRVELLSGPAAGNLVVQYVGQAQLAPTLVGYIEGPPPLPAENLKVYPGTVNVYAGASSVELDDTGSRTFTYSASRDIGSNTSLTIQAGVNIESQTTAGIGVQQEVFALSAAWGLQTTAEAQLGTLAEAQLSEDSVVTSRKHVEARGRWLKNTYGIDEDELDLWFPSNVGFALVRSGTADLFAMRLAGSGTIVGYTMRPNPDIPEDVNVISFRLNDKYVKNGTLDGWIGFQRDKSYSSLATGARSSYFRPLEAYALKQAIEREREQSRTWFENFDATGIGRRDTAGQPGSNDVGDAGRSLANVLMGETAKASLTSEEWRARMARPDMVNTYVWTADGGLYAEEEQFIAVREESTGGSYSLTAQAGVFTEFSVNVGPRFSLNALFGSHIVTRAMKTNREQWQYQLAVSCVGERYIGLMKVDEETGQILYTDDPSPGKVRSYRFMTFLIAPSRRSFDDFRNEVVDTEWLDGTGPYAGLYDPDALALRQALSAPNETWRVLHRVTYVSRVPPATQNEGESLAADVRKPDQLSVDANARLIAELPTDPNASNPLVPISTEADALLDGLAKNPVWGVLLAVKRADVKQDITTYMASYYGIPT